jgi:hypothetical protein
MSGSMFATLSILLIQVPAQEPDSLVAVVDVSVLSMRAPAVDRARTVIVRM